MALRPCATQGCAKSYITKDAVKMQVFFDFSFHFFGLKILLRSHFQRLFRSGLFLSFSGKFLSFFDCNHIDTPSSLWFNYIRFEVYYF